MAGYGSKIVWNDGEGLVIEDLGDMDTYLRRALVDEFLSHFAGSPAWMATDEQEIRPYRGALCVRANGSDLTLTIDRGPVLARLHGDAGLSDDPAAPECLLGYWPGGTPASVVIGAADATQYRRDLIQYRLVSTDEAEVARDFEDATTRAKSSQNIVKRNNTVIEFGVKAGALQATSADADLVANEPDPDAGWFKLASVRVDAAAAALSQDTVWDWRRPMGGGGRLMTPNEFSIHTAGDWAVQGLVFTQQSTLALKEFYAFPLHGGPSQIGYGLSEWEDHRRLISMNITAKTNGAAPDAGIQSWYPGVSADELLEIDARFTLSAAIATSDLYFAADAYGDEFSALSDPPIWANGRHSPAAYGANGIGVEHGRPQLLMVDIVTGAMTDPMLVYSLGADWWGGA